MQARSSFFPSHAPSPPNRLIQGLHKTTFKVREQSQDCIKGLHTPSSSLFCFVWPASIPFSCRRLLFFRRSLFCRLLFHALPSSPSTVCSLNNCDCVSIEQPERHCSLFAFLCPLFPDLFTLSIPYLEDFVYFYSLSPRSPTFFFGPLLSCSLHIYLPLHSFKKLALFYILTTLPFFFLKFPFSTLDISLPLYHLHFSTSN